MSLKDFKVQRKTVTYGTADTDDYGGSFQVRGLNLDDFSELIAVHLDDIAVSLAEYEATKTNIYAPGGLDELVVSLVRQTPDLIAEVISRATDEPDAIDIAKTLPIGLQVLLLSEVLTLTLQELGGIKNLSAVLGSVLAVAQPVKDRVAAILSRVNGSSASIGDAAETPPS